MSRIAAILPAAGLGTRMGGETPKQFLELGGLPLVIFTLRRLAKCEEITDFFIATRADEVASLSERVRQESLGRPVRVVRGGGTRQESVGWRWRKFPPTRKSFWCMTRCGRSSPASRSRV
jgi:2-C-methyl-D-erythritol 4-phosphate cytidylyltransferase